MPSLPYSSSSIVRGTMNVLRRACRLLCAPWPSHWSSSRYTALLDFFWLVLRLVILFAVMMFVLRLLDAEWVMKWREHDSRVPRVVMQEADGARSVFPWLHVFRRESLRVALFAVPRYEISFFELERTLDSALVYDPGDLEELDIALTVAKGMHNDGKARELASRAEHARRSAR